MFYKIFSVLIYVSFTYELKGLHLPPSPLVDVRLDSLVNLNTTVTC